MGFQLSGRSCKFSAQTTSPLPGILYHHPPPPPQASLTNSTAGPRGALPRSKSDRRERCQWRDFRQKPRPTRTPSPPLASWHLLPTPRRLLPLRSQLILAPSPRANGMKTVAANGKSHVESGWESPGMQHVRSLLHRFRAGSVSAVTIIQVLLKP